MSRYLNCALEWPMTTSSHVCEEAFHIIMFGSNDFAQADCVTLLKSAIKNLLFCLSVRRSSDFRELVMGFCWLYGLLRSVNSAQSIVGSLLMDSELVRFMRCHSDLTGGARKKWITLIHSMLRDVLEGRLFLSTPERYKLFMDWHLLFNINSQDVFDDNELTELFTTYVVTFPFGLQAFMIRS